MEKIKIFDDDDLRLVRRGRGWVPVYWVDRAHQWQVTLVSGGGYGSPSWGDIEEVARSWGVQVRDEAGEIVRGRKRALEIVADPPVITDRDRFHVDKKTGPRNTVAA